jgi:hypothetical protein
MIVEELALGEGPSHRLEHFRWDVVVAVDETGGELDVETVLRGFIVESPDDVRGHEGARR